MYQITEYSYNQAKKLNVEIKPSKTKNKKIDVYKNGRKLYSIGDIHYSDYPTYMRERGKSYADERRRLYRKRHQNDRTIVGSRGWYADKILW